MRITLLRIALLPLAVACSAGRDDAVAGEADDTTRSPGAALPAALAADTTNSLASASDTLCAAVAAIAGRTLSVTLARDTGSVFPAPRGGAPWQGCLLRGDATRPRDDPVRPAERIVEAMRAEGWTEDVTYQADGPDEAAAAVRRGAALCHLAHWSAEPPMDDDTAAASAPPTTPFPYVLEILCTSVGPPPLDG